MEAAEAALTALCGGEKTGGERHAQQRAACQRAILYNATAPLLTFDATEAALEAEADAA